MVNERYFTVHEGRLKNVNKQTMKTRVKLRKKVVVTDELLRSENRRFERELVHHKNMVNVASVPYRKTMTMLRGYQRGLQLYHHDADAKVTTANGKFGVYNGVPLETLKHNGETIRSKLKRENYWGRKKANQLIESGLQKGKIVGLNEVKCRFDDIMGRMPKPKVRKTELEELLDELSGGGKSVLPPLRNHTFIQAQTRQRMMKMSTSLPNIAPTRSKTFA